MKTIKIGEELTYNRIESICNESDNFEIEDYGDFVIGRNFIVCTYKDKIVSFVCICIVNNKPWYKCIYSDFQNPTN